VEKIRELVHRYRGAPQNALIAALNPVVRLDFEQWSIAPTRVAWLKKRPSEL
jgi:hypothetical protein